MPSLNAAIIKKKKTSEKWRNTERSEERRGIEDQGVEPELPHPTTRTW